MLIPAALAAACAEGAMRVGTDREPGNVRVRREACMQSMKARAATLRAQVSAHWVSVSEAVQDLVSAGREYCEEHPGSKRGVQAALVIAILLSATALKRSGRALPGSAAASEACGSSVNALQAATVAASSTVKNWTGEYSVPEWLQGSLERLQTLAGQGVDVVKAAGSSAMDRAAQNSVVQGVAESASGAAKSFGDRFATGAGAVIIAFPCLDYRWPAPRRNRLLCLVYCTVEVEGLRAQYSHGRHTSTISVVLTSTVS